MFWGGGAYPSEVWEALLYTIHIAYICKINAFISCHNFILQCIKYIELICSHCNCIYCVHSV